MNNSFHLPKKIAHESTYSPYYGYWDDPWKPGGEGFNNLQKDDVWYAEILSNGMTEVNGAANWSCVFNDFSEKELIDIAIEMYHSLTENETPRRDRLWFFEKIAEQKKITDYPDYYQTKRLVCVEIPSFIEYAKSQWQGWKHVCPKISDDFREKLLSLLFISIGTTTTRDYWCLNDACTVILKSCFDYESLTRPDVGGLSSREADHLYYEHRRNEEKNYEHFLKTTCTKPTFDWVKRNIKNYISWVVMCGNEAQKYADYARGHPEPEMIKLFYEHNWSDDSIQYLTERESMIVYYCGVNKLLTYEKIEINEECPV